MKISNLLHQTARKCATIEAMQTNLTSEENLLMMNKTVIFERNEKLLEVSNKLKSEIFGVDHIIDGVIDSIRSWYVFPDIINKPTIINLWGLTGTGKTQLVRSLAEHLDMGNVFLEIPMDRDSANYSDIFRLMSNAGIKQNIPGIILFDEIQKYKTIENGNTVKHKSLNDIWELLSNGILKMDNLFGIFEDYIKSIVRTIETNEGHWELEKIHENIVTLLNTKETVSDLRKLDLPELKQLILNYLKVKKNNEFDFTKLLIFVSGNLDDLYSDIATNTTNCDTDADLFHDMTKKISIIDVKRVLNTMFTPEQVARFGNTHFIYPSLNKTTYNKIIDNVCDSRCRGMFDKTGYNFKIGPTLHTEIYDNGVFPTQGTRPLFSTINNVLSGVLVDAVLYLIENDYSQNVEYVFDYNKSTKEIYINNTFVKNVNGIFGVSDVRNKTDKNTLALIAVHEAGHAIVHTILYNDAPKEIKTNLASFEGGYIISKEHSVDNIQTKLDMIKISLAGYVAESIIFGKHNRSLGSASDIHKATNIATGIIRTHSFNSPGKLVSPASGYADSLLYTSDKTNSEVQEILDSAFEYTQNLLETNKEKLIEISRILFEHGTITPSRLRDILEVDKISEFDYVDALMGN